MLCSIKKKSDFAYLRTHGIRSKSSSVITVYAKSDNLDPKVGYIASKKVVGNAVKRNKSKRRLRHLVREFQNYFERGDLFLLIATASTVTVKFSNLRSDFLHNLVKLGKCV